MKVRTKILSIWGYVKKWVSDVFILIRRKRKNIESILGQIGWYIIVFGIGAILFLVQREHQIDTAEHSQILFLLVATTGVTVAILISFFFSKLFSERNERIQRKRLIDKFSKKLTALRKISHFLRSSHEYWNHEPKVKRLLDHEYNALTLRIYERFSQKLYNKLHHEEGLGELITQAYLGFKEIEGDVRSSFVFFTKQFKVNYTLNDLEIMQIACRRIWSYLDKKSGSIPEVTNLDRIAREEIIENLKVIYVGFESSDFNNLIVKRLFHDFPEDYLQEQYYYTQLNMNSLGRTFSKLKMDLFGFVILILFCLIILSVGMSNESKLLLTNIVVSGFVMLVLDLLKNVMRSIRKELIVKEIFEI